MNEYKISDENALEDFINHETKSKSIEFIKLTNRKSKSTGNRIHKKTIDGGEYSFERTDVWTCSRNGDKSNKMGNNLMKKLGRSSCTCRITVKKFTGLETLFVMYISNHSHPIGEKHICEIQICRPNSENMYSLELGIFI